MFVYVLIGLLILSIAIIGHELGHFITAKMTGVRVEEFGLGYPPAIFKRKWGETTYSINAIPFGGFNKLTGEEDPSDPHSLAARPRGQRLLVITGGTLANLILAWLFFTVIFLFPQQTYEGDVRVEDISENSPAETAGLVIGDIIVSANGEPVLNGTGLSEIIGENLGGTIVLEVLHEDTTITNIDLIPRINPPEGEGRVGVLTRTINYTVIEHRIPLWQVIPKGFEEMGNVFVGWVGGLATMFSGESDATMMGPIAIVQFTAEAAALGVVPVLYIAGLLNLILGITNMFPIPALDGSRVVFILIEAIRRGKRIKPQTESIIHFVGFALIILFSFVIAFQDIMRLIHGESLLG